MQYYQNLSGKSGVSTYAVSDDAILVEFRSGATYLYTEAQVGKANFSAMQALAKQGKGLSSFIARQARKMFMKKFV